MNMKTTNTFLAARSANLPSGIAHAAPPRWGLCLLVLLAAFFCQLEPARALTPTKVGSVFNQGVGLNLVLNGNYGYVANGTEGLGVVNLSNPAAPTLTNHNITGYVAWVDVSGNYVYAVVQGKGMVVVDVSNPNSPVVVSTFPTQFPGFVKVIGTTAYLQDTFPDTLYLINVSNPAAPAQISSCALPSTFGLADGNIKSMTARGSYAYLAIPEQGYHVIDLANPAAPFRAGTIASSGTAEDIAISGNYAYLAEGSAGLRIVDLSNPVAPATLGTYGVAGGMGDIAVADGYAYVTSLGSQTNAQLQILDVDTPGNITFMGSYSGTQTEPFYSLRDVVLQGNYVYVADFLRGIFVINPHLPSPYPLDPAWFGNYDASMWPIIKHERYGFMKYISTDAKGTHRIFIYNSKITYFTTTAGTFPNINGTAKSKYKKDLPSGKMQIGLRSGKRAFYSYKKKKWVKDM